MADSLSADGPTVDRPLVHLSRGQLLPDDVLARARSLPLKPSPVTLEGPSVRLVPLDLARHAEPLHAVSNGTPVSLVERRVEAYDADALIWRYMLGGPFARVADLTAYLRDQVEAEHGLCLCVVHHPTGRPVGVVNYMNNAPAHLKVELGSIWYSPAVQRTGVNTEAISLLLQHAFALGYRRVEWKCDALNERSRRAALRLGFTFEGIQEYHFMVKGRSRDTAWFRMLDHEWATVEKRLSRLLP
ncbi:MAG: GNAT family N-acetyltransferase [Chloroflexota bacterium]|nr:GNAT family N-acetyltransferase [Chloroflexota bacterium]